MARQAGQSLDRPAGMHSPALGGRLSETVRRTCYAAATTVQDMGVDHRRVDVGMPQQLLDGALEDAPPRQPALANSPEDTPPRQPALQDSLEDTPPEQPSAAKLRRGRFSEQPSAAKLLRSHSSGQPATSGRPPGSLLRGTRDRRLRKGLPVGNLRDHERLRRDSPANVGDCGPPERPTSRDLCSVEQPRRVSSDELVGADGSRQVPPAGARDRRRQSRRPAATSATMGGSQETLRRTSVVGGGQKDRPRGTGATLSSREEPPRTSLSARTAPGKGLRQVPATAGGDGDAPWRTQ